ncbi:ATP-dependent DNA helicase Q-like 3 isoform X3 [Miscanthus floridulus]|uniref:ATP-dependent DNA helicase Q-like 3 isoform X3 n=1 Tax=Miscanthus floridulus TaxID=154761 RepID=UPI0034581361
MSLFSLYTLNDITLFMLLSASAISAKGKGSAPLFDALLCAMSISDKTEDVVHIYLGESCSHIRQRHHTPKKYFGYKGDVVDAVTRGRDCLVVIATGGGKSMCYQLPPLLTKKTAIVISPLLSLMQDQVMSLEQRGVRSDYLGSTQKNHVVVMNYAQSGLYDVLYLTPENAISLPDSFWSNMIRRGICLLAVDEAHCISEWGPDFRIEYKMLHRLRAKLSGIPFLALTATATDSNEAIAELIRDVPRRVSARESTIIYCITIRDTEQAGLFFVYFFLLFLFVFILIIIFSLGVDSIKSLGVDTRYMMLLNLLALMQKCIMDRLIVL